MKCCHGVLFIGVCLEVGSGHFPKPMVILPFMKYGDLHSFLLLSRMGDSPLVTTLNTLILPLSSSPCNHSHKYCYNDMANQIPSVSICMSLPWRPQCTFLTNNIMGWRWRMHLFPPVSAYPDPRQVYDWHRLGDGVPQQPELSAQRSRCAKLHVSAFLSSLGELYLKQHTVCEEDDVIPDDAFLLHMWS